MKMVPLMAALAFAILFLQGCGDASPLSDKTASEVRNLVFKWNEGKLASQLVTVEQEKVDKLNNERAKLDELNGQERELHSERWDLTAGQQEAETELILKLEDEYYKNRDPRLGPTAAATYLERDLEDELESLGYGRYIGDAEKNGYSYSEWDAKKEELKKKWLEKYGKKAQEAERSKFEEKKKNALASLKKDFTNKEKEIQSKEAQLKAKLEEQLSIVQKLDTETSPDWSISKFCEVFGQPHKKQLVDVEYYLYFECKDGMVQMQVVANSFDQGKKILIGSLNIF